MSSEDDWLRAVTIDAPPQVAAFCPECEEHGEDRDLTIHGDPYVAVDNNYPHYEGPGYRWLPVDGRLKSYYLPLNEPRWVQADEALHMRPDDPVLGVTFGPAAWALPWWVMKNHHVANLELAGLPVLITFCEACTSAAAWDPVVMGRRHMFRLDALYNGTISPIDLDSKSAWTGFTGESYFGPLKGTRLRRLPLVQCTWEQWIIEFPNTLVPDGMGERRDGHGSRHFPGSRMDTNVAKSALVRDDRLESHLLVLGVEIGARSRCYPFPELEVQGSVLQDTFEGTDIVIFSRREVCQALAFRRHLDGRKFTFAAHGHGFVDEETGSHWDSFGRATSGPMIGKELEYIFSGVEKFSAWAAFHPGTEIYSRGQCTSGEADALRQQQREEWDVKWGSESFLPIRASKGPDPAIQKTIADGWIRPEMKVLDLGCGKGEMSAWLARQGCKVMGGDISSHAIRIAKDLHDGVPRLKFFQMDVCDVAEQIGPFDAIVDRGCLHTIKLELQADYARNIRAWSTTGTRFLLLMDCRKGLTLEDCTAQVGALFVPDFEILSVEPCDMKESQEPESIPGCVFRLQRH